MRMLRSLVFIALTLCASSLITVSASASVPIDPGLHAVTASETEHPAPMIVHDLQAVAVNELSPDAGILSATDRAFVTSTANLITVAAHAAASPLVGHRMRC